MDIRSPAALVVIAIIAAVVVVVVVASINSWQNRSNPTTVNQPPASQQPKMVP